VLVIRGAEGGTEHLLLGLVREGKGPGPQILAQLGAPPDVVREHVMGLVHEYEGTTKPRRERLAERPTAESAGSAQNCESAAALRGREKQLAAERDSRWEQWSAAHQDLPSLSEEVERLRGLLHQHGLDAEDGTA
jgi:hypothetical protein